MAKFKNNATLSYNGNTLTSNEVTGELVEVITATKEAIMDNYTANDDVTYVVTIVNSGTAAVTGVKLLDNLGEYNYGTGTDTLVPLTYTSSSLHYYQNGVVQPNTGLTITAGPPFEVRGITVPAGGTATLIYETVVNQFAPLEAASTITNKATISEGGISTPVEVQEVISTKDVPNLTISKALSPTTITENGQITYTFTIENYGNTATVNGDNVIVKDIFDPILDPMTVTFNGTGWTNGTEYDYNTTDGKFETKLWFVKVPAATYTQDAVTGAWTVHPGVSTLVITGTV